MPRGPDEQVRNQGLLWFGDVDEEVAHRLEEVGPDERRVFAIACANRVMRWHMALPMDQQRSFTLEWRAVLEAATAGLRGEPAADARVRAALDAFHASPYDHADGQDGPDDADENAAAAAIYAAECFLSGATAPARWAANRAVDNRFEQARLELRLDSNDHEALAQQNMHAAVQTELVLQLEDLAALSTGNRDLVLDRPDH